MGEITLIDCDSLEHARKLIADGKLIVFPTDTVYGIACDPYNNEAIDRLFAAKQRPREKTLQVLMPSVGSMEALGLRLPLPLDVLSERFLPGAFSPICDALPTCRLKTVRTVFEESEPERLTQAIRVPDCAESLHVLTALGALAVSSANLSGEESATTAQEAQEAFGDAVALYFDGGATPGPVPSTVVAADATKPDGIDILREGVLPEATVRAVLHETPTR